MNYPNGKKMSNTTTTYANRGMGLEEDINLSNTYYLERNIAIIHKRPTSITIKKVEYPNQKYTKIIDGYFNTPSTTDYNGLYKGYYIDFEAKETKSKTSFPLSNIHAHQLVHIKKIIEHGGMAFIIIRFSSLATTYLLNGSNLIDVAKSKKSISIDYMQNNAYVIKENYAPRLDYLKIVDDLIKEKQNEEIKEII